MKTPREIRARYPYMFAGPNIGFTIYRGWFQLFANACAEVDSILGSDRRGFHWVQLKEKFGHARWYWRMDPDPAEVSVRKPVKINEFNQDGTVTRLNLDDPTLELTSITDRIDAVIEGAMNITQSTCVCCGASGENHEYKGLYLCLCEDHAKERRRSGYTPKTAYFTEDET